MVATWSSPTSNSISRTSMGEACSSRRRPAVGPAEIGTLYPSDAAGSGPEATPLEEGHDGVERIGHGRRRGPPGRAEVVDHGLDGLGVALELRLRAARADDETDAVELPDEHVGHREAGPGEEVLDGQEGPAG